MKSFFKEIFEYHHHYNQLLLDELIKHKKELPERTYPLFCHIINAHQIWNARIMQAPSLGVHEVHQPERCREIDVNNLKDTLYILEHYDLEQSY